VCGVRFVLNEVVSILYNKCASVPLRVEIYCAHNGCGTLGDRLDQAKSSSSYDRDAGGELLGTSAAVVCLEQDPEAVHGGRRGRRGGPFEVGAVRRCPPRVPLGIDPDVGVERGGERGCDVLDRVLDVGVDGVRAQLGPRAQHLRRPEGPAVRLVRALADPQRQEVDDEPHDADEHRGKNEREGGRKSRGAPLEAGPERPRRPWPLGRPEHAGALPQNRASLLHEKKNTWSPLHTNGNVSSSNTTETSMMGPVVDYNRYKKIKSGHGRGCACAVLVGQITQSQDPQCQHTHAKGIVCILHGQEEWP
jgi:hypothetical protein